MNPPPEEVTGLLDAWSGGDEDALARLLPLVMGDLRRLARRHLVRERADESLQATELIHEVYLRLTRRRFVQWANRRQFFAGMGEIMRRILVDRARRRSALKKGGGAPRQPFDETQASGTLWGPAIDALDVDILALDAALQGLAAVDPRQARLVELRYFAGLTIEETAGALEVSPMTVKRDWHSARLWLLRALDAG